MKYANLKIQAEKNVSTPKNKQGKAKFIVVLLVVVGIIAMAPAIFKSKLASSFNPVSIVAQVTTAELKETDGRTNILILGSDKRSTGTITSELTDTILVASIGKVDKDVVLISLPRDLWVQSPKGYREKINAIYTFGGAEDVSKVAEEVLGMPIHYHIVVTFDLFTEAIDTLGGIPVNVEHTFTDNYYPIEGKENAPENERYEVVHFDQGVQTMNGETALKFARSRKGDNNEGTDFARSKRQQKVIAAIKEKALSAQTLLNPAKVKDLYDLYAKNIDTNIDLGTVQNFYLLSQEIDFSKVVSVVLDDRSSANEGGLLYAPEDTSLYGGRYVLVPKTGDYSQIHAYVQRYLFGDKE